MASTYEYKDGKWHYSIELTDLERSTAASNLTGCRLHIYHTIVGGMDFRGRYKLDWSYINLPIQRIKDDRPPKLPAAERTFNIVLPEDFRLVNPKKPNGVYIFFINMRNRDKAEYLERYSPFDNEFLLDDRKYDIFRRNEYECRGPSESEKFVDAMARKIKNTVETTRECILIGEAPSE